MALNEEDMDNPIKITLSIESPHAFGRQTDAVTYLMEKSELEKHISKDGLLKFLRDQVHEKLSEKKT